MRDHAKDAARLRRLADDLDRSAENMRRRAMELRSDARAARDRADLMESTNADLPDSDTLHRVGLIGREK